MNSNELIELAAIAAGIEIDQQLDDGTILIDVGHGGTNTWNPIDRASDTMWLAAELGISIDLSPLEIVTAAAKMSPNGQS
jgi:hypothetical protein